MQEVISMSLKELDRLKVLTQVTEKKLSQTVAAKRLGISDRQVRNLIKILKIEGDKGLISKKRGKLRNHSFPIEVKNKTLELVSENYLDFGPKLASEYLKKHHLITISKETLRKWMIERGMWQNKMKKVNLHPSREKRKAFGELIQIDGSHHNWLEERGPKCVLMVFIDDATSMITSLHFSEGETLEAYYQCFAKHLNCYGIPLSLYGDHCSVLSPRCPTDCRDKTQFQLALKELDCQLILANSPQAKGRVERANRTLQKRLIRFLRVKNIKTVEEANQVLEEYRLEHNQLFSKKPSEQMDVHRPLEGISIERVLCTRATRTLSKDNVLQFENTFYQIFSQDSSIRLYKKAKIEIRKQLNRERKAFFKGKQVDMVPLGELTSPTINEKDILEWKPKKKYIPPTSHPYKRNYNHEKELLGKVV